MGAAFGWGLLASSSLVIGAVIALRIRIPLRVIGLIMGFGAGVLISAVAFDLVEEAAGKSTGHGALIAGLFAGCLAFFGGDRLIDHLGGGDRKDPTGAENEGGGSPLSIVLGTVLDGIPESMVIGLTIFQGGAVGAAYLAAVFISNLPEAISSTSGLLSSGWGEVASPPDVDRDRIGLRRVVAGRLRPLPRLVTGRGRVRPDLRSGRDPDHAGQHDDARGVRARRQARRNHGDAGVRDRVHDPPAGLSVPTPMSGQE
jgi:hypothetical protein